MNRVFFFFTVICCILFLSCLHRKSDKTTSNPTADSPNNISADTVPRTSITFILGRDDGERNPYYSLANDYYRLNKSDKTEIVIDTIFSLLGVRNYLEKYPPNNGSPWGLINLVSHGNEFIDLSVDVFKGGPRTSAESLLKAIHDTIFKPLSAKIIDSKSLLYLHGCSVGQNKDLLKVLGFAFGGPQTPIPVKASKLFEYYAFLSKNKNPQMIRHYFAKVWYGFYKYDSIPDEKGLVAQFQSSYPQDKVNWLEAVRRQYPANPSEIYHITFGIPVIWEDFYARKELMPVLNTKTKQANWFANNRRFQALIKKTKVPLNYFNIKYYNSVYKSKSAIIYSLKVKARVGVICIIKPLITDGDKFTPFNPPENDTLYFSFGTPFMDNQKPKL